jgi:hypothetical protein
MRSFGIVLTGLLMGVAAVGQTPVPTQVPPPVPYPQTQMVPVPNSSVLVPPVSQYPPAVVQTVPTVPVVPVVPVQTALTFGQACSALRGLPPGQHTMVFVHPVTKCPVSVTFQIRGCVTDTSSNRWFGNYRLVLKVAGVGNDVALKFKKDGRVVVDY